MALDMLQTCMGTLEFARRGLMGLLEATPEDKFLHQPYEGANHALWIMGHLACTDEYFMNKLEGAPFDRFEAWNETLAVNINGHFYCARKAVPLLKKSGGGSIINISSTAGLMGYPYRSPYSTSKWAVIGFTKTLAMELGEFNIRVNDFPIFEVLTLVETPFEFRKISFIFLYGFS